MPCPKAPLWTAWKRWLCRYPRPRSGGGWRRATTRWKCRPRSANIFAPGDYMPHNARPLVYAVGAMALVFSWQWATVQANYGGNWSALYCTGARLGVPSRLAAEHIYEFPGSFGFDGQMYHYVAHDPLIRTPDLKAAVDAPWLRYRRILVPGLAYMLALGRANWVDPAYFALVLIFIGAGVYWSVECSQALGRSPAWGLLFLLMPATLISMDRLVL